MAARRGSRTQTPTSSRLESLLFGIGCLVVLTLTFALGVTAGRRWPTGVPLPGLGQPPVTTAAVGAASPATPSARGEQSGPRRSEARSFDPDKGKTVTDGLPVLTYYRDLTAPLTPPLTSLSSPPPTRTVAKAEAPAAATIKPIPAAEPRFTVQVGAFSARSQAEALRARLAHGRQEAEVTEIATGGVTQYRVRVGTFATREAARHAATRLGTERQLATYVTTR